MMRSYRLHHQDAERASAAAADVMGVANVEAWLTVPTTTLDGRTPLQAIMDGEVERVIDSLQATHGGTWLYPTPVKKESNEG